MIMINHDDDEDDKEEKRKDLKYNDDNVPFEVTLWPRFELNYYVISCQ